MGLLDRLRRTASAPLNPVAAAAGVQERALLLIDVREPAEYRSGHAHGAINVPLAQLSASLDALSRQKKAIGFICHSGARSAMAVRTAARGGTTAQNVRGGMLAWERAGLPTATGKGPRLPTPR